MEAGSKTLDDLIKFAQTARAGGAQDGDLASLVDDLAQTVPEMDSPPTPFATLPTHDPSSRARGDAQESGILGLASEVSALNRKLRVIDENVHLTDSLALSAQNLRILLGLLITRMRSGVPSNLPSADLSALLQQKKQLDALTAELKSLSPAIVALDKQKLSLTEYK